MRPTFRNVVLALYAAILFLAGCTVPLGPGFQHSGRQATIGEVASSAGAGQTSPLLHIRITDQLENIGNTSLRFLDVQMPAASVFGVSDLSIRANGRALRFAPVTPDAGAPLRVEFPSWGPSGNRSIVFDYDLDPGIAGHGSAAATLTDFYIANPAAFPVWIRPMGPFAKGNAQASYRMLEIALPSDSRVLGPGEELRTTGNASATLYSFRVTPADFPLFVVSGKYREQIVTAQNREVIFWTLQPIDARTAQDVAARLATTAATLRQLFGPEAPEGHRVRGASTAGWPIHVVQTSAVLPSVPAAQIEETTEPFSATSFPEGVLVDHGAIARGLSSEPVLELAEYELARTWFGWRVRLPEGQTNLLGDGAGLYGVIAAAEAREGEAGRRREISRLLAAYDREQERSAQPKLPQPPLINYTSAERVMSGYKAALFFVALADLAGKQNFEDAMHRLIRDMAGEQVQDEDLRAAFEAATGKNLAEMFRMWIGEPGIPGDFRSRYRGD